MKKNLSIVLIISSLLFLGFTFPGCAPKDAGVWRSDDGGENWSQKVQIDEKLELASVNVLRFVFDPNDPQKIYLGTEDEGMYFSPDGGDNWQKTAIERGDVWDIAIDPEDSDTYYVAVFDNHLGRVYGTYDAGENWETVFVDTIPDKPIYNILIDWYNNNLILSTGWGGILQSRDQGKTWEKIAELSAPAGRIYLDQEDSRIMWYRTPNKGIFKTEDGGESWEEIALNSLEQYQGASRIYDLEIDWNTGNFYLATNYGLLLSQDRGRSWEPIETLVPFESVPYYAVASNPQNSQEVLFTADNTLFKSVNEGGTWQVRKLYTGNIIRHIKYHPENPDIIYLGIRRVK